MKFLRWLFRKPVTQADARHRLARLMADIPRPRYRTEWAKPDDRFKARRTA